MKKILNGCWAVLLSIQKIIMILSSGFILLGLVATVILRYVFQTDLFGLEELILIPAFWMYFMGASYGTYKNEHITADITNVYVKSDKLRDGIQLLNKFICFVIAIILSVWASGFVLWNINSGATSSVWNYPVYIPQTAILAGFVLMSFYLLVNILKDAKNFVNYFR
ncbi:TRAP transporter small permease [Oceanobacillus sojae]|uniref:TRAP transporter small permease n=1 Tax=Oceanobacillus sojae TaxID=582851 RepID=UPI0009889236|nr:TRAP transporter small permease [Oceanobacillus sojae]MCT1903071.1 TRAP transporter small permease [Oceanobacillus sojae]